MVEPFVTQLGTVMHHYELEWHVKSLLSSWSRSKWRLVQSGYDFLTIFWTAGPSAAKVSLIAFYKKLSCLVQKIGLLCSRSRTLKRFSISLNFSCVFFSVPLISVQPDWVYCCCVTKYQTKCGQTGPVIILITTLWCAVSPGTLWGVFCHARLQT